MVILVADNLFLRNGGYVDSGPPVEQHVSKCEKLLIAAHLFKLTISVLSSDGVFYMSLNLYRVADGKFLDSRVFNFRLLIIFDKGLCFVEICHVHHLVHELLLGVFSLRLYVYHRSLLVGLLLSLICKGHFIVLHNLFPLCNYLRCRLFNGHHWLMVYFLVLFLRRLVRRFFLCGGEVRLWLRLVRCFVLSLVENFSRLLLLLLFRLVMYLLFLMLVGYFLDNGCLWFWLVLVIKFLLVIVRVVKKLFLAIARVSHTNRYEFNY